MADKAIVLVTGATGQQGGSLINALPPDQFAIHAMTRKPDSDAAKALAARGITIVPGDLDDRVSLRKALAGVWGVFAVQNTWEAGVEKEEEQGKRLATMAREAGVQQYVYSSVASAQRNTGIPHFENKWRVEGTVRTAGFPSYTIFRPVFFMENVVSPGVMRGDTMYTGLTPDRPVQMIAAQDLGRYMAHGFTDAVRLNKREIDLAGDSLSMAEAARELSAAFGRAISYVQLPMSEVSKFSEDLALMQQWFEAVGYDADISAIESEFGIRSTKFAEWAREQAK